MFCTAELLLLVANECLLVFYSFLVCLILCMTSAGKVTKQTMEEPNVSTLEALLAVLSRVGPVGWF